MNQEPQYLSKEKIKELELELERLKTVDRKKVAEHLDYAKSLGDLSENAEYHEARDRQADIEDRIKEIEVILKNAVVVTEKHGGIIDIGSVIVIKRDSGEEKEYTIVGSEEADMALGKISYQSPLGAALIGHKKGDKVVVSTPRGDTTYLVVNIK